MANLDSQDIALLISAVQHYKRHSETQRQERNQQGWDTAEQSSRITELDSLEEQLFDWLDARKSKVSSKKSK